MSGSERVPPIRGVVRAELIADLALGELSQTQLSEKYGRTVETIDKFQYRNKDEIRLAQQEMSAEDRGLFYAKKQRQLALLEQWIADTEELLSSGELTVTQRKGYYNLGIKLVHAHSEMSGFLPVRSQVDVQVSKNPFEGVDRIMVTDDGAWHAVDNPARD